MSSYRYLGILRFENFEHFDLPMRHLCHQPYPDDDPTARPLMSRGLENTRQARQAAPPFFWCSAERGQFGRSCLAQPRVGGINQSGWPMLTMLTLSPGLAARLNGRDRLRSRLVPRGPASSNSDFFL